jgi:phage host-nuclease inhibitor protein Gam
MIEVQTTLATEDVRPCGLAVTAGSRLLAPLRAEVERLQIAARAKVSPVADGEAYCPLLDFVADQIETLDRIEEAAKCTQDALMDAVHERHGYDTWPAAALEAHIIAVTALRDSVQALANSVRALCAAEREAFDACYANS